MARRIRHLLPQHISPVADCRHFLRLPPPPVPPCDSGPCESRIPIPVLRDLRTPKQVDFKTKSFDNRMHKRAFLTGKAPRRPSETRTRPSDHRFGQARNSLHRPGLRARLRRTARSRIAAGPPGNLKPSRPVDALSQSRDLDPLTRKERALSESGGIRGQRGPRLDSGAGLLSQFVSETAADGRA